MLSANISVAVLLSLQVEINFPKVMAAVFVSDCSSIVPKCKNQAFRDDTSEFPRFGPFFLSRFTWFPPSGLSYVLQAGQSSVL